MRVRDWDRAWHAVPLAVLAVATVLAVAGSAAPPSALAVTVALAVATALWHGWMVMAHPHWPERALAPMAVYFAGLLALSWVLSARHPAYALLVVACFPMAFVALPGRYAYLGVAATGLLVLGDPFALSASGAYGPRCRRRWHRWSWRRSSAGSSGRWRPRWGGGARRTRRWRRPTRAWRGSARRTPPSRASCWPPPAGPAWPASAGGWPARSTTPSPRGWRASSPSWRPPRRSPPTPRRYAAAWPSPAAWPGRA
ncbi:hypothetical protein ACFQQB_55020 [Nonomuraea rubra]|uniref:hypothetical protein n=1 Tax=Nonomuraea rubra TaxID=46180 RepID=UPI003612EE84